MAAIDTDADELAQNSSQSQDVPVVGTTSAQLSTPGATTLRITVKAPADERDAREATTNGAQAVATEEGGSSAVADDQVMLDSSDGNAAGSPDARIAQNSVDTTRDTVMIAAEDSKGEAVEARENGATQDLEPEMDGAAATADAPATASILDGDDDEQTATSSIDTLTATDAPRKGTLIEADDASAARFEDPADEQSASASGSATPLASPPLRDVSPALSATSESPSTSAAPVASTSAVAYSGPPVHVELPLPFIQYPFANTTLVPLDSRESKPFQYTTWPPEPLEESWARSRRGDDPEADLPPTVEFGYFATKEEVAESKRKEELRRAKIRARVEEYELERGSAASRGRGSKVRARAAPARARASKGRARGGDSGSREASAEPAFDDAAPQPARRARPAKSALRTVQPGASDDNMAVDEAEPSPARPALLTNAAMARMLLPNDLQTALPSFIKPHPAAIDPLDLPPYYLPTPESQTARPTQVAQAADEKKTTAERSPEKASSSSRPRRSVVQNQMDKTAAERTRTDVSDIGDDEDLTPITIKPKKADVAPVADSSSQRDASSAKTKEPAASKTARSFYDDPGSAAAGKRVRSPDDEGREASKKQARDEPVASTSKAGPAVVPQSKAQGTAQPGVASYRIQKTTCLSKMMDGQIRCWQCIARGVGHGCSFMGVRSFGHDWKGDIVTGPVFLNTKDPDMEPQWDKPYTSPMTDASSSLLKTWTADSLIPILRREAKDAKAPDCIRIQHLLQIAAVCDTCYETMVCSEWMCKICGRSACPTCFARLKQIDKLASTSGNFPNMSNVDVQRRRKCIAKTRGKNPVAATNHSAADFIPLSRYDGSGLETLLGFVQNWWNKHELAPVDPKVQDYLRKKFVLASNLKDYDENTHPVWTFQHRIIDDALFFEAWRNAEPIVIRRCPPVALAKYTPEYFAQHFGGSDTRLDLIHNRTLEPKISTMGDFFGKFQTTHERRQANADFSNKQSYRPKPTAPMQRFFPTSEQWKTDFKPLMLDFFEWLPLPNIFHPHGLLNLLAHSPENASAPDRVPEIFTSWETDAATASMPLQTRDHDLLSHMLWGASDPRTGKLLRIRWDVFRAEDRETIRDFCWELMHNAAGRHTASYAKFRTNRDDPTLNPSMYLTKKQRQWLFERTGIKPYPVYQYMGDTVLIPAGCPFQVSSWIDHININLPFLAGTSAMRAWTLHNKTHLEQKERSLWRFDNCQIECAILYTYLSAAEFDSVGVGKKQWTGKLNWPFPRDDKNRPIVPEEEQARLQELADVEARGLEIGNEIKKAGTAAYDEARAAGLSEAECKARSERAKDAKAAELRAQGVKKPSTAPTTKGTASAAKESSAAPPASDAQEAATPAALEGALEAAKAAVAPNASTAAAASSKPALDLVTGSVATSVLKAGESASASSATRVDGSKEKASDSSEPLTTSSSTTPAPSSTAATSPTSGTAAAASDSAPRPGKADSTSAVSASGHSGKTT